MTWSDPSDYSANAIPTTSGAESTNINTKIIAKLRQLYDYFVGDDTEAFLFKARTVPASDFKIQLSDDSGVQCFTLLNNSGGTVLKLDSTGQIKAGYLDAEIIAAQFPGDVAVATKVNNVRILAPYTFTANEIAAVCEDSIPPSGSSMQWRAVNSVAGTIGTVTISAGNSIGSSNISPVSIIKNSVFTFDCVQKGASNPGRDVHIQIRGYRTGTIQP